MINILAAALQLKGLLLAMLPDMPVTASAEFRVIASGRLKAVARGDDDHQVECELTEQRALAIIESMRCGGTAFTIDFDQQAFADDAAAPAAGWFQSLAWRADGLYVTDARWTPRATSALLAGRYRCVMPAVVVNQATGCIDGLINLSLAAGIARATGREASQQGQLSRECAALAHAVVAPFHQALVPGALGLSSACFQALAAAAQPEPSAYVSPELARLVAQRAACHIAVRRGLQP